MILDPASCKAIFVTPHPSFSSLPTQQQHFLHQRELHITHSERQIYEPVQQGASSYRLLSVSIFLFRAYCHTSASRLCFAQMCRVSLSLIVTSYMMTSCDHFFRRQRTSLNRTQPALCRERLPLGTAERSPGATYPSQNIRAHTVVAAVFQRMSAVAPSRQQTNADCLLLFWTRKRADLRRRRMFISEICFCTDNSVRTFSKKCHNFHGKFEREFWRKFRDSLFLRKLFIRKGFLLLYWDSS